MKIEGKVWKFGSDLNTDLIIPARYLNTSDPDELAKHCMVDADPEFSTKVQAGDIIVAEKNFGCGSSREHAPIAIKALGISTVIASSFARIFYRNAFNIGLPIFESLEASTNVQEGDILIIDTAVGSIKNLTRNEEYTAAPIPPFMQELISDGGLMAHVGKRI